MLQINHYGVIDGVNGPCRTLVLVDGTAVAI
jgi:hypothetical protein